MALQENPIAVVSSACRLPLGITRPSQLWDAFCNHGDSKAIFTSLESVPDSRRADGIPRIDPVKVGGAGWLGKEGVESFDPDFFNISPVEAQVLRPNTRLALELTWEVLERAGIPPASLRGRNIAVSIGMGTEDGWDIRRFLDDEFDAFDHRWAANSDPSGVSGQIAHFFDFHGPASIISSACSSGAFALRDGIYALLNENCEYAVVGAVTTHFVTAAFDWATSVNIASKRGQCAAFSDKADGYVPSEGAVFFLLRRLHSVGSDPVLGVIRSLAMGHNGATRTLTTPNASAQAALTRRSLRAASLSPSDISILEAHGTGTRLGDALEAEAFVSVYDADEQRHHPLWVSSSKTLFGHCQAASMLVGILKVLACFEHRAIPPHLVDPLPEFKGGQIMIPTSLTLLPKERHLIAQVCNFGFTGSIASFILEEAPDTAAPFQRTMSNTASVQPVILPFSAKTVGALDAHIEAVYEWACRTECSLYDLGALLSLCREHHPVRMCVISSDIHDLSGLSSRYMQKLDSFHNQGIPFENAPAFLNLSEIPKSISEQDKRAANELLEENRILHVACLLYNKGHKLGFNEIYDLRNVVQLRQYLQTFPTYAFERKMCWRGGSGTILPTTAFESQTANVLKPEVTQQFPSITYIAESVASVLCISAGDISYDSNIVDMGLDSLNSVELARTLSHAFGVPLPVLELYSLLTVQNIYDFFVEKIPRAHQRLVATSQKRFSQADVDAWVTKYGTPLDTSLAPTVKEERSPSAITVLLTGANGMLGCQLLHDLLSRTEVAQIFCPVRGVAWERLSQAYASHGHNAMQLAKEKDAGRVVVFHVSDLGDEDLGCSSDAYRRLVQNVDTVIHLAWRLDFNLPVTAFRNCIEGTRHLARLSLVAKKRVAYYFISSFSAYFGFGNGLIPEQPLTANLSTCLDQGYAISKLIAEHALFSMFRTSEASFTLRVVRIGQICGNSVTGIWSPNEMVPMMIKSLPMLSVLPRNMPDVTWIPSDICAIVLADFVLSSAPEREVKVLHVANPRTIPWTTLTGILTKLVGLDGIVLVTLRDYVDIIRSSPSQPELPITRLLPYFTTVSEQGDFPSTFASLDVRESLAHSTTLATCPEIDEEFLRRIVRSLLGTASVMPLPPPVKSLGLPVFLFGPWAESITSVTSVGETETQIQTMASQIRREIQYNHEDKALNSQLATLASQVVAFEELRSRSVFPKAVLGYCFGEYAASVCAGILSLETAVDIIVRRAAKLHGVKGSMLNVFADLSAVKRQILKFPFVLEIAIHAGPKHFVLSGSSTHITAAQPSFQNAGIRTTLVRMCIPFHSTLVDHAILTLQLPNVDCNPGSCTYVSGLTGSSIGGKRLSFKYWLRHMRDPVLFVDAVQYIRNHFLSSPLVDLGPGRTLSSIISRYNWDGCQLHTFETFLGTNVHRAIEPVGGSDLQTRKVDAAPKPSTAPVRLSSARQMGRTEAEAAIAAILVSDFGFKASGSRSLLLKSFLMLGLQSLDFISFTEKVLAATGLVLPALSFASDLTLSELLASLMP